MPREQRVSFASYHLTEEANLWWQAKSKAIGLPDRQMPWERFEVELWTRFGPLDGEDFDEALCHIQQKGSLLEFQREFERLQNKVEGWTEKALVGAFMGGLHKSISSGIRIFKPKTLLEVINYARLRDDQLQQEKRWNNPRIMAPPPAYTVSHPRGESSKPTPPRKLSWEELKKKRSLGLCFSCDDNFFPRHKCKQPQLFIMESEADGEEVAVETTEEVDQSPEITLHALTGWDAPTTIRLRADIGKHHLLALVDSGLTHNFISLKAAQRLRLQFTPTPSFWVRVANGEPLTCAGKFDEVLVQIGEAAFTVTLHAVPLVGLDLVLGVKWLESLGPTVCDWKARNIQIEWAGRTHTFSGLQHISIHATDSNNIVKEARQGQTLFAICLSDTNPTLLPVEPEMQALIQEFDALFHTPDGLPPRRAIEHRIPLKEGTNPVNVRPYRYAYFQKEEIEKQVSEMLTSGIIRPSCSPFSSPVLLVKKKDGSWRFCTDYRALNAATIKDRFPIPTVEDMLDELHGATFFTKLDLTAGYHQVQMHPSDVHKTAFRTHNGHYEYLVMPFGLCNAPSTFQALMNEIFRPLMRKSVMVFFDDILVYSPTWTSHLQHVREVFSLLHHHGLSVKFKKCDFGRRELEYLGHIISTTGVKVVSEPRDCKTKHKVFDW
ncbi:PREDICTED: uncharacterized protein LOC104754084 [Camelina sativa]|uniref:Uncharacterized protein LOC104754084 n=1 Tax=Camelina sativa TaxID=90675 RepID=A0ABM0WQ46_CAMSA|nr:PREDICTED: uncharacterized protein LOC104754084 [Camelina sativa]